MATDDVTLDALRQRVTDIDRQLITLVAERKRVSGEVARVKRATGYPTRISSASATSSSVFARWPRNRGIARASRDCSAC